MICGNKKKSSFVVSYLLKPMCTKKQRTVGHAPRTKAQLTQRTHQLGKKARCRCCNCKVGGACATIGARAGIWTEACCSFLSACQIRAESVGSYAKTMVTSFPPTVCAHRLGSAVIKFWWHVYHLLFRFWIRNSYESESVTDRNLRLCP
jgi:hypothetical protein